MKLQKYILAFCFILGLFILSSCQKVTDELAGVEPKNVDQIVIKFVPKSSQNPVFQAAKQGAIDKAKILSEKYKKFNVTVDWEAPRSESPSEQADIIRKAINDSVNAIAVSCIDIDTLSNVINFAVDKGIPVMTFDSDCPDSKRFSFYGPDDVEIGKAILQNLARAMDKKGSFAILGGNFDSPNLQQRIKGIKLALQDYPDMKLIDEFYHPENEKDAVAMVDSILKSHTEIKGFAMAGSWPLFGDLLLNSKYFKPGEIKMVGVDALPVELKYIEKNYVQVLLGQPTFKWGEVTVEKIIDKIYFNKKVEDKYLMKVIPVTIENLGGWSRQLRAWGYKVDDEKLLLM